MWFFCTKMWFLLQNLSGKLIICFQFLWVFVFLEFMFSFTCQRCGFYSKKESFFFYNYVLLFVGFSCSYEPFFFISELEFFFSLWKKKGKKLGILNFGNRKWISVLKMDSDTRIFQWIFRFICRRVKTCLIRMIWRYMEIYVYGFCPFLLFICAENLQYFHTWIIYFGK